MKNNLQRIKQLLCAIVILVSINGTSNAQPHVLEWVKEITSRVPSSEMVFGTTTDLHGNLYMTGIYSGKVDFDPGPGLYEMECDIYSVHTFILKMNSSGQLLWVKEFVGDASVPQDIAVDKNGNIYTTGYFFGYDKGVDFNPGNDTFALFCSFANVFISKLDSNGNFVWANQLGDNNVFMYNQGYALNVEDSGAVYVTGAFVGEVDFDPGQGSSILITPAYYPNIFICKLHTADGSLNWARSVESIDQGTGTGIGYDPSGHIFITGTFLGTHDFNPDVVGVFNMTANGTSGSFLLKLDTAGDFKWAKQIGGVTASSSNASEGWAITMNSSEIYLTGRFQGTVDFDPGANTFSLNSTLNKWDCYITKLDTAGEFAWARQIGGDENNSGVAITRDGYGNIYTWGNFEGTTDINSDSGSADTLSLTAVNGRNVFIVKLRENGDYVWGAQLGDFDDYSAGATSYSPTDFCIDYAGNIYAAGHFVDPSDFDPGAGVAMLTDFGIYIVKLRCGDTTSEVINHASCTDYELNGISYNATGTYTQIWPNTSGCDSTITLNLTIEPLNTGVTEGNGQLRANWNDAIYQWIDCEDKSVIAGATSQIFIPESSGNYAVIVSKYGCSDTSDCFAATGISDLKQTSGFSFYPNPVTSDFTLLCPNDISGGKARLINNMGQIIWDRDNLQGRKFVFSTSGVPSGVYMLELTVKEEIVKMKVIKN